MMACMRPLAFPARRAAKDWIHASASFQIASSFCRTISASQFRILTFDACYPCTTPVSSRVSYDSRGWTCALCVSDTTIITSLLHSIIGQRAFECYGYEYRTTASQKLTPTASAPSANCTLPCAARWTVTPRRRPIGCGLGHLVRPTVRRPQKTFSPAGLACSPHILAS